MEDILKIQKSVVFDESISNYEIHTHQPFAASKFGNNDEISITVQHQDLCLLPSKSSLHICGRILNAAGTAAVSTKLVSNAICHLFEEIRYELNGVEIDRSKNVGLTTLMKNFISQSPNNWNLLQNAGWIKDDATLVTETVARNSYFDISIPLSFLLGFAEDYDKIIVNAKHELILTRTKSDFNAVYHPTPAGPNAAIEKFKLTLDKIEWLIPYIKICDERRIKLLNFIAKDTPIAISFRTWELYEYPLLPSTSKHVWVVKTSNQLEKPRYVILGFQTKRRNEMTANASRFDHCKIRDVRLFLNSQGYPYGNLNLNIDHNQYTLLYNMYVNFQNSYYGKDPEPLLDRKEFLERAPLIVIDCSKQNEYLKSGPVDVRLEFEASEDFPDNTSAYCLILHHRMIEYNPISGGVKKIM